MIDPITISGGLVADPQLRYTPNGRAVAQFRIAQSDHKKTDTGEWEKTNSLYLTVSIWNDNPEWKKNPVNWAELAAELHKGDRVAVHGKLITRTWEAKDGSNRSQIELAADMIFVIPTGTQDSSAGFGQQQPAAPQGNTWGQPATTGQAGGSADEQPPF